MAIAVAERQAKSAQFKTVTANVVVVQHAIAQVYVAETRSLIVPVSVAVVKRATSALSEIVPVCATDMQSQIATVSVAGML